MSYKKRIISLLIAFMLLTPMSFAATNTTYLANVDPGIKPDSIFYIFDKMAESFSLFFTFNKEKKIKRMMGYAEERLAEAQVMAEEDKEKYVKKALKSYNKAYDKFVKYVQEPGKVFDPDKSKLVTSIKSVFSSSHVPVLKNINSDLPDSGADLILKRLVLEGESDDLDEDDDTDEDDDLDEEDDKDEVDDLDEEDDKDEDKGSDSAEASSDKDDNKVKTSTSTDISDDKTTSDTKTDSTTDTKTTTTDTTKSDDSTTDTTDEVKGCTDSKSDNYNSKATKDDGSCYIKGCMTKAASNYNTKATKDDGSCIAHIYGCTNPLDENYKSSATKDDGSCKSSTITTPPALIKGCMDDRAMNFNPDAKVSDGYCKYLNKVYGCMNRGALNYDPKANTDNGRCEFEHEIWGCLDPNAMNHNPEANRDDGKCDYPENARHGCTEHGALNFNPEANINDGSCEYEGGPGPDPGAPPPPPGESGSMDVSLAPANVAFEPDVVTAGDVINITAHVKNNGDGTTPSFRVTMRVDNDQVQQMIVNSIPPNGLSEQLNYSYSVPNSLSKGSHTFRIIVDSLNEIQETDEANNDFIKTFNVQ